MSRCRALLVVVVVFGAVCAEAQPIRPLPLVAGQVDSVHVADLVVTDLGVIAASIEGVQVRYLREEQILLLEPEADVEGFFLVPLTVGADVLALPVLVRRLTPYTFTYPDVDAERIHVIGQFNDWSRTRDRLERRGDGTWFVTLALDPGRYEYKFTVDGAEVLDPANPERVPNPFGDFNNILVIPPRHDEHLSLHVAGFDQGEVELAFERDGRPASVPREGVIVLLDNAVVDQERLTVTGDRVRILTAGLPDGSLRVLVSSGGQASRMASVSLSGGAPLGRDEFLWRDAIMYQIMVDRFHDGDAARTQPVLHDSVATRANYHGGDLQGVLDKLREGYFTRLGINTIWLSPVIQNTERAHREHPPPHRWYTGYHGYWPTHPTEVDHRFGDIELLRSLVEEARERGIHVLLDFVANHTHEDHPFFRENRDWYGSLDLPDGRLNLRLWDEQRLTTWFEPYLPSFDFQGSDEALEAMTDNALWWLRESGAAGFRHDAVKHIPNRFWRTLTRKIKQQVDADRDLPVFQIGETFGSYELISSYVNPGQLDAQFNFNLYDTALYVFLNEEVEFSVLDAEMHRTLDVYGIDHLMGNLMDSHDKPRFPALLEGHVPGPDGDDTEVGWHRHITVGDPTTYGRIELYLAYMLTVPGVPTIYYGNEIGKTGANDPDNRRPMRFDEAVTPDEGALKVRVQCLVHLRRSVPALRRGGFHTLHAGRDTWAYLRADAGSRAVVALNKGPEQARLSLQIPIALAGGDAMDALTGQSVSYVDGTLGLDIPPGGYRVIVLERH